jgi:glycosyltransferase involved in cell wall biosynthesis
MHPKVSIVVPVYNVEDYLRDCLESLANQTYKNIEIICVNDGSTDASQQILNEYKEKYDNIVVIEKTNSGVSSARNVGLEHARGDYVTFVDSDDFLDLETVEKCIYKICSSDAQILSYGYYFYPLDEYKNRNGSGSQGILKRKGVVTEVFDLLIKDDINNFVTTKFYKRRFLTENNLKFAEGVTYLEDDLFTHMSVPCAKKIFFYPERLYYWRQRPGSLSGQKHEEMLKSAVIRAQVLAENWLSMGYEHNIYLLDKVSCVYYYIKKTNDKELAKESAKKVYKVIEKILQIANKKALHSNIKKQIDGIKSYL